MKKIIFLSVLCLAFISSNAQQKKIWDETEQEKNERLAWWTNDRFGLFVHWGLYSLAGRQTRHTKNTLTISTRTCTIL
jgi:alpha-L-fucosidase